MTKILTPEWKPPLSDIQQDIVAKLEECLEVARDGGLTSIALLCVGPNGYAVQTAGKQAAELNLAADNLKHRIREVTEGQNKRIVRPR